MIRVLAAAALAASALAVGAAQAAPQVTVLRLKADPGGALKFDKKTLAAKAGKITIVFTNPAVLPHNIAVKGPGVNVKAKIIVKSSERLTVKLKRGTYTFYCSVPGHAAAGMKGKLVVR